MAKAEGCIDVFNFVKRGRENRMNFVQTAEQYEFIHTAVMEATLCGDTSIPASDFRQIYGKLQTVDRKTKKSQLQVQWENLGKVSRKPRADECEVGKLEENSDKNRFNNILPFDRRRLRLMTPVYDDEFSTDYINASFVSAYTVKESFMVTQMPLPNTIVDLWRMVYDYKSTSIVMLNDMNHNDMTLGQYWPDEGVMQCGPFLLETVKTDNMKNITTRTIHLTNAKGVVQIIQQFQVTCWPADQEFPTSKSVIVDLMSMVEKWQKQTGNGPVTVHCINGIGRCGVYCASVSTCDRIKVDQMVDIFQAVKALRANRPHMVESMAQYKYCHDVILDYFESFDTYSNFQ
uniref:Receptor-type tyrosine-protein phosphatase mu-like n=1 Tax=Saccoglossus kowalevskii TaxID=10224 RepID=A0ABM0M0L7_SACKO|nr:PREDICTED: receptor-type tyrosine-protein phosphatase mu-like [Saccoglossus kowalevskii]